MARPENRSEARALSLTLPVETFNYLALLATLGKLGRTENEVATHILVREVYAMHAYIGTQSFRLFRRMEAEEITDAMHRAVRRGQIDLARRLDRELSGMGLSVRTYELAGASAGGSW